MNESEISELDDAAMAVCRSRSLEFVEFVGSGAFKRTYKAIDDDGELFAVKVCRQGGGTERTEREIETMERLTSPHFATLHGSGICETKAGKFHFLVEELLEGGTLSSRQEKVAKSLPKLASIGRMLSQGLAELQAEKVAHRDIKPDNIMFRKSSDDPVIVDFGLVRVLDASSLTATWQPHGPGTPFFSSPEQLKNEKHMIDWRTDQFSTAVTIYHVATGFHPYQRADDEPHIALSRVLRKEQPTERFCTFVDENGLGPLRRMAAAWPSQRFCDGDLLSEAWEKCV